MYLWEHDYEALRDMVYDHVQRTVKRYERAVHYWKVVSGVHAFNNFNLTFEQLMELTRMTCQLVKKIAPRSQVVIELVMPWSEYYARNQKSIPPLLYADMAVQSGIKFDAFGVQVCMGVPVDGHYVRDLMQVSTMLDEFLAFGKPLHVTACQVPSDVTADAGDAWSGEIEAHRAGQWHVPWSQRLQAEWLQGFFRVAISKPFVESVCWRDLADTPGHFIPHGGLCTAALEPKLAYKELRNFKAWLLAGRSAGPAPRRRSAEPPAMRRVRYDLTWRRAHLAALLAVWALGAVALGWRWVDRPIRFGSSLPILPGASPPSPRRSTPTPPPSAACAG